MLKTQEQLPTPITASLLPLAKLYHVLHKNYNKTASKITWVYVQCEILNLDI